jgi:hypothetical protein
LGTLARTQVAHQEVIDHIRRQAEVTSQGSGFRVQDSGCRVQGSGFRVQGSGFGFMVQVSSEIRV